MAIVYQTDKRSGITYAYQSVYHWDKEKRQSRCTRTLLGRADPITREITSTDGRGQRGKQAEAPTRTKSKASSSNGFASRCFYGATYLLDSIGEKTGVSADLAQCFRDPSSIFFHCLLSYNGNIVLCSVLKGGAVFIDIHSGRTSHPSAAAICLHPSRKSVRTHSFISSPNAAPTMNTGLTTPPPYPVPPSCSDRCSTARTRKMRRCRN